ncbi:MAG TPA: hypothetical protein VKT78_09045 [Fimbriimonadaceae bacterium]|nr:hypothetical protein [Fimbriimonadaceae bacterium]
MSAFLALTALACGSAWAQFNLGGGQNYGVLFQGYSGNTLQITNVTINGNVGVGNNGKMTDSGPSTINGRIDFSAGNTNQFSNNNGSNVITGGVNYGVSGVTNALNWVNSLSQTLNGDAGTSVAINGIQTINASSGSVFSVNGQSVHVFDASSFNNNGTSDVLTINGSSSDLVAINLGGLGNIQFHGGIVFTGGISADHVIFNIGGGNYSTYSGGYSLDIQNNGGVDGLAQGIFLDPNGAISTDNSIIEGRLFGGDSHDFQFVSGGHINAPPAPTPEPFTLGLGVAGIFMAFRRVSHARARRLPGA